MRDVVYILSPSYSGSTLLTFLLAQHPDVSTIGELKGTAMGDLSTYKCSCGELFLNCSFWQSLEDRAKADGVSFDRRDYRTNFESRDSLTGRLMRAGVRGRLFESLRSLGFLLSKTARRELEEKIEYNARLVDYVAELQGASVFVDGSKDPVRLKLMQASGRFNIKVLRIVRDGRGTTLSFMRNEGLDIEKASSRWLRANKEVGRVYDSSPTGLRCTVSYEELCSDVERVMESVWQFIGISPVSQSAQLDLASNHVVGNRMRLDSSTEIRLDEKWREALSASELDIFERIAGADNRLNGYTK